MRDICEDVSPTMLPASSVRIKLSWGTKRQNYINKTTCLAVHTQHGNMTINIMRHTVEFYMIQRLIVRSNDITGNMRLRVQIIQEKKGTI